MQGVCIGEGDDVELTDIQAVKIWWDCECTVTFLKGICSGNFKFLVSQHTLQKEPSYGFVIDFSFFM